MVTRHSSRCLRSMWKKWPPGTGGAYGAPLFWPILRCSQHRLARGVDPATCEAACGALANICVEAGAHGAAAAARPALPLLAELAACADNDDLAAAATQHVRATSSWWRHSSPHRPPRAASVGRAFSEPCFNAQATALHDNIEMVLQIRSFPEIVHAHVHVHVRSKRAACSVL